jgi:MFS transporter, putative metabolite transport protein
LAGTAVGYAVLVIKPDLDAWRWMYATAVVPALLVTIARFFVTESANWLHSRGAIDRATVAAGRLLKRTPQYPANIVLSKQAAAGEGHGGGSFMDLFKKRYRRSPILASVPWFLQDLSTYGIGIFTPTILAAALGKEDHVRSLRDLIANDILAARGAALITALLIVGIAFAVLLADKLGRIEGRSCRDRWTAN